MNVKRIYSKNADYQKFEVLKSNRNKRYRYNQFFVEGVRNINEALKNSWHICSFVYTRERPLSDWAENLVKTVGTDENYECSLALLEELSGKTDTSELMAVVEMREDGFEQLKLSSCPFLALFDRPSNKGNLGTMIRSCDSLGVEGLILTGHGVDLYDPEVVGASMGSFFNIPVIRVADQEGLFQFIREMKSRYPGFQTLGTTAHKETILEDADFTLPTMLYIGNETEGLSKAYKESCDRLITIPMSENSAATSFNVACAASILFYEVTRQRRSKAARLP